jgi:threonine synthase
MPRDTPRACVVEAQMHGADVRLIDGLINDCGRMIGEIKVKEGWFDMSTLKEPYRLEGKKTMGLELAEQMDWAMPDVLLYPTGGGTGLVGIPKGYEELREMGWLSGALPRIVAVQAEGCAPVVKAFHAGAATTTAWENPTTHAAGLRVPSPFAGRQMLDILRTTKGDAVAVSERQIVEAQRLLARLEGIWTAPEAAALVAALGMLTDAGWVTAAERVVLVLTGAGIKYAPPETPTAVDLEGSDADIVAQVRRVLTR